MRSLPTDIDHVLHRHATLGWWWADPAAGYVLVFYAARGVRAVLTDPPARPARWAAVMLILKLVAFVVPLGLDSFAVAASIGAASTLMARTAGGSAGCS